APAPDPEIERHGRAADQPGRPRREGVARAGLERDGHLPDLQAADPRRHAPAHGQGQDDPRSRLPQRRLRPGDRQVMATNGYSPRLKDQYDGEIRPHLKDELGLKSVMQVPRITKITLNMG